MAIKAIGFDYLGVVTQLGGGVSIYRRIAEVAGVDPDSVYEAYQRHNRALQTGELTVAELWTVVAHELGVPAKAQAMVAAADETAPVVNQAVLDLVDRLKARGYKVGLLSNLSGSWIDHLRTLGIDKHFDATLFSGEIRLAKPDPRVYEMLAHQLGVATAELMFIDDSPANLEGLGSLGVTPILFGGYKELTHQLALQKIEC